jgi:hypothetical protein
MNQDIIQYAFWYSGVESSGSRYGLTLFESTLRNVKAILELKWECLLRGILPFTHLVNKKHRFATCRICFMFNRVCCWMPLQWYVARTHGLPHIGLLFDAWLCYVQYSARKVIGGHFLHSVSIILHRLSLRILRRWKFIVWSPKLTPCSLGDGLQYSETERRCRVMGLLHIREFPDWDRHPETCYPH